MTTVSPKPYNGWTRRCANSPGPWSTLDERIDMTERTCSTEGCARLAKTRGMCNPCYQDWYRTCPPEIRRNNLLRCQACGCQAKGDWCEAFSQLVLNSIRSRCSAQRPPDDDRASPVAGDCWVWTGALTERGYGRMSIGKVETGVHRFTAKAAGILVPDLHLDHLCRNPPCVNPAHLEPVTNAENKRRARKVRCINGHLLEGEAVYIRPDTGGRQCRLCASEREKRDRAKRTEAMRRRRAAARSFEAPSISEARAHHEHHHGLENARAALKGERT